MLKLSMLKRASHLIKKNIVFKTNILDWTGTIINSEHSKLNLQEVEIKIEIEEDLDLEETIEVAIELEVVREII